MPHSAFRKASAQTITAIIPYFGYARQDRKTARVPISAAAVAHLIETSGVDRVVAVDLHCGQIQGMFGPRLPVDNLGGAIVALPHFTEVLQRRESSKVTVVSPDAGGVERAKKFQDGLRRFGIDAEFAMISKTRSGAGVIASMKLIGDVSGSDCIIVDDMIDTAGTLVEAGNTLRAAGADRVYAFATHGLFNKNALDRIDASVFDEVVVCNTVPLQKTVPKITQLSLGGLLAEAIDRIHNHRSVSVVFSGNTDFRTENSAASSPTRSGVAL